MRRIVQFAAGLLIATSAFANDSGASIAAGGLIHQRTDAIDLLSEDLYVSADEIRVHYVFRNRTPKDVETIVAFPMPDLDLSIPRIGSDLRWPSNFRTRVAGQPVPTRLDRKAVLKGKDNTALLTQLHIPIGDPYRATRAMDRLPTVEKKRLLALGLAEDSEYDAEDGMGNYHHLSPLWTVQDKYRWRQRFPASRDVVVDHRYNPGAGPAIQDGIITLMQPRHRNILVAIALIGPSFRRYRADQAMQL